MNELVPYNEIKIPEIWNYETSVSEMIPLINEWKKRTQEMLTRLWIAREKLSQKGSLRSISKQTGQMSYSSKTWTNYCKDIGIDIRTANRWLAELEASWQSVLLSQTSDWYTPAEYINSVKKVLKQIDLDPASCEQANNIIQAKQIYTKENNGLDHSWRGKIFLNPPYGKDGPPFVEKLNNEFREGNVTEFILLVNSRATDAEWFQPLFDFLICFTDHRIDFDSPNEKANSSTHGSCFIYAGNNEKSFAREFSKHGTVLRKYQES
ncbi:phage N-6-adenine-methyltransferase [bacterium]|nr:phage N-6-adenine-methyltransferase [bacterium]